MYRFLSKRPYSFRWVKAKLRYISTVNARVVRKRNELLCLGGRKQTERYGENRFPDGRSGENRDRIGEGLLVR